MASGTVATASVVPGRHEHGTATTGWAVHSRAATVSDLVISSQGYGTCWAHVAGRAGPGARLRRDTAGLAISSSRAGRLDAVNAVVAKLALDLVGASGHGRAASSVVPRVRCGGNSRPFGAVQARITADWCSGRAFRAVVPSWTHVVAGRLRVAIRKAVVPGTAQTAASNRTQAICGSERASRATGLDTCDTVVPAHVRTCQDSDNRVRNTTRDRNTVSASVAYPASHSV